MAVNAKTIKQIKSAAEQGLTQAETARLLDMNESFLARTKSKYNIEFIKCFNQKINHLELLDLSKILLFSNDKINYITQYKQFVIKYIEKLNHYKIY